MLNLRKEIVNKLDMRGTIALNAELELGMITAEHSNKDAHYVGLNLKGQIWYCCHPVYTFGTVKEFAAAGMILSIYLRDVQGYSDALSCTAVVTHATDRLLGMAADEGLL